MVWKRMKKFTKGTRINLKVGEFKRNLGGREILIESVRAGEVSARSGQGNDHLPN